MNECMYCNLYNCVYKKKNKININMGLKPLKHLSLFIYALLGKTHIKKVFFLVVGPVRV